MCKAIFILKEVDIAGLAESFALLKVPSMPELKDRPIELDMSPAVDVDKIPFADKVREKARLKRLESGVKVDKENKHFHKNATTSWAKKKEQKSRKEKRKLKKIASKSEAT